jgi:hypothetical protein
MINPSDAAHYFNALDKVLRIEELYLLQRVAQKIGDRLYRCGSQLQSIDKVGCSMPFKRQWREV